MEPSPSTDPRLLALLPPAERLLLLAQIPGTQQKDLLAIVQDPGLDWSRVSWLGEREKAASPLWKALRRLPEGAVPGDRAVVLTRIARVWDFRMLRLQGLLADALDTLSDAGTEVVLLKGAALGARVYGSFANRPMSDLDILVPAEDAPGAWEALRGAGWVGDRVDLPEQFFASHHHLPPLLDPYGLGVSIELHTATGDDAISLPGDMIRGEAGRIEIDGRATRVPAPEHLILHLATHFVWGHEMGSASWRTFRDLRKVVSHLDVDWERLVRRARETRSATCLYWTLRLAQGLTGVPVPQGVLGAVAPPRPRTILAALERHYVVNLFEKGSTRCPSVRISRLLWTAGVAPGRSGHGVARPWTRGEAWAALTHPNGLASQQPAGEGIRAQWREGQEWMRYLRAVLGVPAGPRED